MLTNSLRRSVLLANRLQVAITPATRLSVMASAPLRTFAYHERVLDHYNNPRNVGTLPKKAANVGTGLVGAPACGDVMKLQI